MSMQRAIPKKRNLSPEEKIDLIAEVARLLEQCGIKAEIQADIPSTRNCIGCLACTCLLGL